MLKTKKENENRKHINKEMGQELGIYNSVRINVNINKIQKYA